LNIGLIGVPKSGKTTVFNALTGKEIDTTTYSGNETEPNLAVVEVSDPRIDALAAIYSPERTIYATVELVDFPGVSSSNDGAFGSSALGRIRNCDALAIVLRNFSDAGIDAELGVADPKSELGVVYSELLLADQIAAEKRLQTLSDNRRKGRSSEYPREAKILESLVAGLDEGKPVSGIDLDADAARIVSGFQFLTSKPAFGVVNSGDEQFGSGFNGELPTIEFAGRLEAELAVMTPDDAALFLSDAGIAESARARLTTFAYQMLGYVSFFTVGDDEVRAWSIRKGSNAVAAAGAIHSDLARGFIRAEVFRCEDILEHESEAALKRLGKVRLEGKEYIVDDGDVISVRFSV